MSFSESENGLYYCEDNFKSVQNQLNLTVIREFLSSLLILRLVGVVGKPTRLANFTLLILALAIGGCLLAIIIVVSGAVTFYLQVSPYDSYGMSHNNWFINHILESERRYWIERTSRDAKWNSFDDTGGYTRIHWGRMSTTGGTLSSLT